MQNERQCARPMEREENGADFQETSTKETAGETSLDQFQFKTTWTVDNDLTTRAPQGGQQRSGGPRFAHDRNGRGRGTGGSFANNPRPDSGSRQGFPSGPRPFDENQRRQPTAENSQRQWNGYQRRDRSFNNGNRQRPWFPAPPPDVDYTVSFYASDETFNPIADRIHKTGKTFETFRIAKSFLESPEKFVFVLRKTPEASGKFYHSPLDGIPFSSLESAIDHLIRNHLSSIFDIEIVEGSAPNGSFSTVVLCPFTKRPIAAPNHHSYKKLLNEHFLEHIYGMSFEKFCERLETSSAPDDIQGCLDAIKRCGFFRRKNKCADGSKDDEDRGTSPASEGNSDGAEVACSEEIPPESMDVPPSEKVECECGEAAVALKSLEEVRDYLRSHGPDYISTTECIRVPGSSLPQIHEKDMRHFIEFHWFRQKRFPLETSNGLRAKFKQHNLHSYKRGKKGISYVCASPRKFREMEVRLADELELILDTIEQSPLLSAEELSKKLCGDKLSSESLGEFLKKLIRDGYVTEFEDGTLLTYARPVKAKREGEKSGSEIHSDEKSDEPSACESCVGPCDCEMSSAAMSEVEGENIGVANEGTDLVEEDTRQPEVEISSLSAGSGIRTLSPKMGHVPHCE